VHVTVTHWQAVLAQQKPGHRARHLPPFAIAPSPRARWRRSARRNLLAPSGVPPHLAREIVKGRYTAPSPALLRLTAAGAPDSREARTLTAMVSVAGNGNSHARG